MINGNNFSIVKLTSGVLPILLGLLFLSISSQNRKIIKGLQQEKVIRE
ncbi:MAG: hypothetical protein H7Y18_18715 [Clostridiaceae bacterium]|nr:hypothetical protein [Clostridiaceae bacterium]